MLDAHQILSDAEAQVGINDSDFFARSNLEQLVRAINTESLMSEQGLKKARQAFVTDTINRLEGLKWLQTHPKIADEPIESPVFLMGLPRSGTTYFHYLFDCDKRFRLIRTWEAMTPYPPPGAYLFQAPRPPVYRSAGHGSE